MTIEVRLHRELYRKEAVESAAKTFEPYAAIERADDDTHYVLRLTSGRKPERLPKIARELANWALGTTIKSRPGSS